MLDGSHMEEVGGNPYSMARSMITRNSGGSWELIAAPQVDANGEAVDCLLENSCSLHLYGTASWVGASKDQHHSVCGLIMTCLV